MRSIVLFLVALSMLAGCSTETPVGVTDPNVSVTMESDALKPGQLTPFRGSWISNFGPPADPGVISLAGHGIATKIGKNSFTSLSTVDPFTGIQTGSTTIIAANGDELTFDFVGISFPPDAEGTLVFSGEWTFVDGTGRFTNVVGSGTYEGTFSLVMGTGQVSQVGTIGR